MYSNLAVLSKLIYHKKRRFFIQAAFVLKARTSNQNSLTLSKPSWCTQISLFYLKSYISWKTPDFLSKPLLYSKLALLSKPRLLYPNPADVLKVLVYINSYISWKTPFFYQSLVCTQSALLLYKVLLLYQNLADVLKVRFYI